MEDLPQESPNMSPPATEKTVGKKRKLSASSLDDEDQPAAKYLELADIFTLDRFSDEILFEIFKNVDTIGLLSLEKTCTRFCCLVQDHRLWNDVNLLSIPKSVEDLTITLNRTTNKTKTIKINGLLGDVNRDKRKDQRVCLLNCLVPKCENLIDLELQNVFVDFLRIQIKDFPKNLKRLVFRDVSVRWPDNSPTVFQKMDRHLISLEELRVESCTWFHPYDIMLFSKCPSLKTLSMRGCQNLSDFVPYGSMASRFGFKTLEHLDVRDTPITDSDLQCFNAILTLKELLLQCPNYLRIKTGGEKNYVPPGTFMYTFTPASCVRILSPIPYYRESGTSAPHSSSSAPQSTSQSSSQSDGSESDSADSNTTNAKDGAEPSTSQQADGQEPSKSDLQNQTRTVILHGRVCEIQESEFKRIPHPDNPQGQFSSLLRHPHFWDMIDRQTGPDCGPCVATKPQICPISNRGISCFGRPENPIDRNVIWIRIGHRPNNNNFERLSARHYKRITDDSLRHLVQCSPNLVYLDVTGCGVTKEGLEEFKAGKPTCEVVCKDLIN